MRLRLPAAVLAAILFATPAAAQSQAEADQAVTATRAWLAESARWVGQHNQIMAQRTQHLTGLRPGADGIEQRVAAHDVAGARAAAARWTAEQQAVLTADHAALSALSAAPRLDLSPALMNLPGMRESLAGPMAHLEGMPPRFAAFMEMTDGRAAAYMSAISAAVDSPQPERAFGIARIDFAVALFESENALLDATLASEGGGRFVSMSTIQSNSALAQWYGHVGDLWRGTAQTRPARAAAIRAAAVEIRADADQMVEAAAAQNHEQADNPAFASASGQAFISRYQASFVEAAGIERQMADVLDQLAQALAAGQDDAAQALADRTGEVSRARRASHHDREVLVQQLSPA